MKINCLNSVHKKGVIVFVVLIFLFLFLAGGILSYYHLSKEIKSLKTQTETLTNKLENIKNEKDTIQNAESRQQSKTENSNLENRITNLETTLYLLGETLGTCEVVKDAYGGFQPAPGYQNKLDKCVNSYIKFKENIYNE